jgi:hypothetical protein
MARKHISNGIRTLCIMRGIGPAIARSLRLHRSEPREPLRVGVDRPAHFIKHRRSRCVLVSTARSAPVRVETLCPVHLLQRAKVARFPVGLGQKHIFKNIIIGEQQQRRKKKKKNSIRAAASPNRASTAPDRASIIALTLRPASIRACVSRSASLRSASRARAAATTRSEPLVYI